jgi:hypothetical protein
MYQQLWGYKVEEKLYLGVREQKRLNTTVLNHLRVQVLTAVKTSIVLVVVDLTTLFH